jgi:hypothetical protein
MAIALRWPDREGYSAMFFCVCGLRSAHLLINSELICDPMREGLV